MIVTPTPALAAYGPYPHGFGIKSLGFGGIGVVAGEDSYTLVANPALASDLDERYDFGLDWIQVLTDTTLEDNLLGPDARYSSDARHFFIPQAGVVFALSDELTAGFSGFAAGLGTDYGQSPYQRFGGADRSQLTLGLVGLSSVISYQLTSHQSIGIGLNLSYQLIDVQGLPQTLALFSESPQHFTDQGYDGAAGVGFSVGWHGWLTPWLEAGAGYRSKTWAGRFRDYAGLLPDGGRLELPAAYGVGIAVHLLRDWTIAIEAQQTAYSQERATGNDLEKLRSGSRFGSQDGPGFGWNDQTIYKLGVAWQVAPDLKLRAGYSHANQLIDASETLLNSLAPNTLREHFTTGLSYMLGENWEVSGYAALASEQKLDGENSIPLLLGGGEANLRTKMILSGISFGRNFDP